MAVDFQSTQESSGAESANNDDNFALEKCTVAFESSEGLQKIYHIYGCRLLGQSKKVAFESVVEYAGSNCG